MSLQEKYQSLIDMAAQNGTNITMTEADGVLHIDGTAPSAEAKQQLWDEYNRIDPDYRAGDLVLNISGGEEAAASSTYTVQPGDSLSKIGAHHGVSWKSIFDANRDVLDDPDEIQPGQELKIPSA